jgi:hypothetical protein
MSTAEFKIGDIVERKTKWKREPGKIDQMRANGDGFMYHIIFPNFSMWCIDVDLLPASENKTIDLPAKV